jgi:hypothetical protein
MALSTNNPTPGNPQANAQDGYRLNLGNTQELIQKQSKDLVDSRYNSGVVKPYAGPTARSLFYNAATYDYNNAKYGQYLFYSIVGNHDPNFYENYYLSERTEFNSKVSEVNSISGASRNPSAGFLVRQSKSNIASFQNSGTNIFSYTFGPGDHGSYIIGGASAPYDWKDFLFCKYYGHIPNNYMVTLRRFPSPMRDNLSLPSQVKNSDIFKVQGAGRPVAQAVTWWGGNTENKLSDIVGFSTGLNYDLFPWDDQKINQAGTNNGLFKILEGLPAVGKLTEDPDGSSTYSMIKKAIETAIPLTDAGFAETTQARRNKALRDKATNPGGPLSEFIWVSVDTVNRSMMRTRGVIGEFKPITLNFHYELTSVGEVNTKATMLDIMGNLLSLCTNYANFLTPEIRYDNGFPEVNFPGGDLGLNLFYSDPVEYFKQLSKYGGNPNGSTSNVSESGDGFKNLLEKIKNYLEVSQKNLQSQGTSGVGEDIKDGFVNFAKTTLSDKFIEDIYMPQFLLTGAPVGEWHLVVGNPCNPIAMIGNLVCTGLVVTFGESLGPDDFPTEMNAAITVQHGTERERGQIESMFNRGEGRMYQSVAPVYSNTQSTASQGTTNGDVINIDNGKGGVVDLVNYFANLGNNQ